MSSTQRALASKAWDVVTTALDGARANPTDLELLDRGLRAVELLVQGGIIAPPGKDAPYREHLHVERPAEPEARLQLLIGPGSDRAELERTAAAVGRSVAERFGVTELPIELVEAAQLEEGQARLLLDADIEVGRGAGSSWIEPAVVAQLPELLTREVTAELLERARRHSPMVVQELVPNMLSLGQLRQVLQHLLAEGVPVTRMSTILNALADTAVYSKDPRSLTEHVRQALGRSIHGHLLREDTLDVYKLSPDAERAIQNAVQLNEQGQVLMLDPGAQHAIRRNLADALDTHAPDSLILVVSPKIRRHVRGLLVRTYPDGVVLSSSEIDAGVSLNTLAMIDAHLPGAQPQAADTPADDEPVDENAGWNW